MSMEKRSYADRAEYLKKAVTERRKKLRTMALDYKGGKCVFCGYSAYSGALDFHYLSNKSFGLSARGLTRSWDKIREELDKCVLVCANCHREVHAGLKNVDTIS
jgi:hypothetical protein